MTGVTPALPVPTPEPASSRPSRGRRSSGSPALDALYQQMLALLTRLDVQRLSVAVDDRPGWAGLRVAGVWRVDRELRTGRLELFQWTGATDTPSPWVKVDAWTHFPDVQLLPLRALDGHRVLRGALNLLLDHLGWGTDAHWCTVLRQKAERLGMPWPAADAPVDEQHNAWRTFRDQNDALNRAHGTEHLMDPDRIAWWKRPGMELFQEFRRHERRLKVLLNLLVDRLVKPLRTSPDDRAIRGMVKRLWQHAVDPGLLKMVGLARMRQAVRWTDYAAFAQHAPALRKVHREHPNLLPMLDHINPRYWGRPNLFSRRRWVRDGRKELVIETSTFRRYPPPAPGQEHRQRRPFVPFEHPAAFRWMLKASPLVINRWMMDFQGDGRVLERCVRLNLPPTTSPLLWDMVIRQYVDYLDRYEWFHLPEEPVARATARRNAVEALERALRQYALHLQKRWETHGMRNMLQYNARREHDFPLILDWIKGEAGALGLPDKNARWESMHRACTAWHERRRLEAEWNNQPFSYSWFSPWGEPEVINGVRVTVLTTSEQLWQEGTLMKHCVGWNGYDRSCYEGSTQILSLVEEGSTRRSTLSLVRMGSGWKEQQNYSYHNQQVTPLLAQVGKLVVQRMNDRTAAFYASGEPWPAAKRTPQTAGERVIARRAGNNV